MGLRSSIDCPTSSTQSIFMTQSKGMHQVTNILLHFNQQSTSNVMHVFLVLKEGDGSQKLNQLLIFIHTMLLPFNSANICGPIKRYASRNQHTVRFLNQQFTSNVMHVFCVLKEEREKKKKKEESDCEPYLSISSFVRVLWLL